MPKTLPDPLYESQRSARALGIWILAALLALAVGLGVIVWRGW